MNLSILFRLTFLKFDIDSVQGAHIQSASRSSVANFTIDVGAFDD